jgi:hypothetical protein
MRKAILAGTILLLSMGAASVQAQLSQNSGSASEHKQNCGGPHLPGDTLTCYVTFDGTSDFAMVQLIFRPPTASGSQFILQETRQLDPQTYEVSGTIPPQCLPGSYTLLAVGANLGWNKGHRLYPGGFNLSVDILAKVEKVPVGEAPTSPDEVLPELNGPVMHLPTVPDILMRGEPAKPETNRFPDIESITGCRGTHAPGERLTCDVRFGGEVELSSLAMSFDMSAQERAKSYARAKDQQGLCMDLLIQEFSKIAARTYRVTGLINPCAAGDYFLESVSAVVACGTNKNCRTRAYRSDHDIETPVTFRLQNSAQRVFPEIRAVGSSPPAPSRGVK